MPNGEEYEAKAAECRQLAAQMKNPKLKKQLDDMAEGWDRLARQRRHQSSRQRKITKRIACRDSILRSKRHESSTLAGEKRVGNYK